jgi:hypothetical protein
MEATIRGVGWMDFNQVRESSRTNSMRSKVSGTTVN